MRACVCVCCSPFEVMVGLEAGFQKVRAWGPGLKTGMVGKSADFVVETIGTDVGILGGLPEWEQVSVDESSTSRLIFVCSSALQASPSKVRRRLRSNATIKATARATCAIGPPSLATMLCMWSAMMKTSKTAPSSPTSYPLLMTSSLRRYLVQVEGPIPDHFFCPVL